MRDYLWKEMKMNRRYRNTRIKPKPVQEAKEWDERSVGDNHLSPFLETTYFSLLAYSLFKGTGSESTSPLACSSNYLRVCISVKR